MDRTTDFDGSQCMGSGICAGIVPDLFALDGPHARQRQEVIAPDERALDAADSCPAPAITVREEGRTVGSREE